MHRKINAHNVHNNREIKHINIFLKNIPLLGLLSCELSATSSLSDSDVISIASSLSVSIFTSSELPVTNIVAQVKH